MNATTRTTAATAIAGTSAGAGAGAEPDRVPPPGAGEPAPGLGRRLRDLAVDAWLFAGRNARHTRQVPEKLLDVTLQPVMFVLLFAYVFGGAIALPGGSYREYMLGGVMVMALTVGMTGPAGAIATDLTEGIIERFRALPTSRAAYLVGHFLAELAGMGLALVVTVGSGLVVGWRPHAGAGRLVLAVALLVLFASASVWVGTAIGLAVRTPDAVMGVAFSVVFPATFLSNAFVPVATLPGPLQWVASWNPLSAVVSAVRLLFGNPVAPLARDTWITRHPVDAAFAISAAALVVGMALSLRLFARRTTG